MASITQIRIKGRLIGIIDLDEAIAAAKKEGLGEDQAGEFLLSRIKEKNYIPPGCESDYARALTMAYARALGLPTVEDHTQVYGSILSIKILGPGCINCEALKAGVMGVLEELSLAAEVVHIKDPVEIASFGVMGTPALVINEKVISVGKVPSKAAIKEFILSSTNKGWENA